MGKSKKDNENKIDEIQKKYNERMKKRQELAKKKLPYILKAEKTAERYAQVRREILEEHKTHHHSHSYKFKGLVKDKNVDLRNHMRKQGKRIG